MTDTQLLREARYLGRTKDGGYLFESSFTPEACKAGTLCRIPPQVIVPIIFVPGIMGSNLKAKEAIRNRRRRVIIKKGDPVWRVDSSLSLAKTWLFKGADVHQLLLQKDKVEVDDGGKISQGGMLWFDDGKTPQCKLAAETAKARGWGQTINYGYFDFMDWLELQINGHPSGSMLDVCLQGIAPHVSRPPLGARLGVKELKEDDLIGLLRAQHPVHAFGYNWLQDNALSARELRARIETICAGYVKEGYTCEQVILVTHSMGGLVARAASVLAEDGWAKQRIAGVFHGEMPTQGAGAAYKRMVSGTAGDNAWWDVAGWAAAKVLGPQGQFITPRFAFNPGPQQLLPTRRYNSGKPWLIVKDKKTGKQLKSLPKQGDPYPEIYREQKGWWKLFNNHDAWVNPAGLKSTGDVMEGFLMTLNTAEKFHDKLHAAGDFHPNTHARYGRSDKQKTYGQVVWVLEALDGLPLDEAVCDSLERADVNDGDMDILLTDASKTRRVRAMLVSCSKEGVGSAGDGTVPAEESASSVGAGVAPGNLLVADNAGYEHATSYESSESRWNALQGVVRILTTMKHYQGAQA